VVVPGPDTDRRPLPGPMMIMMMIPAEPSEAPAAGGARVQLAPSPATVTDSAAAAAAQRRRPAGGLGPPARRPGRDRRARKGPAGGWPGLPDQHWHHGMVPGPGAETPATVPVPVTQAACGSLQVSAGQY
jgi:hypothetical protein